MRPRQIRLERLRQLVQEAGSIAEVARRSGTSEKYLGQILQGVVQSRGKSPRAIGDKLAQKLEMGCAKPAGWMDQPLDIPQRLGESFARYIVSASLTDEEASLVLCWRKLFDHQRAELLPAIVRDARNAVDVEAELERRKLNDFVPDDEVGKHLPRRPPQRDLPIIPPTVTTRSTKKGRP